MALGRNTTKEGNFALKENGKTENNMDPGSYTTRTEVYVLRVHSKTARSKALRKSSMIMASLVIGGTSKTASVMAYGKHTGPMAS
jgi:hypothetical protein